MSTVPLCASAHVHCTGPGAPFAQTAVGLGAHLWDSALSLRTLAAHLGIPVVKAETEKRKGEFSCFATGCQALSADPRAQCLKGLWCPVDAEVQKWKTQYDGLGTPAAGDSRNLLRGTFMDLGSSLADACSGV